MDLKSTLGNAFLGGTFLSARASLKIRAEDLPDLRPKFISKQNFVNQSRNPSRDQSCRNNSNMEISQPSVLTRLPHTSGITGRILFAQVHGVRNGIKRKRQEICAVIDGNSVSIYEVSNHDHNHCGCLSHSLSDSAIYFLPVILRYTVNEQF